MTTDAARAEAWQEQYAERARIVAEEVKKRKAAEAELATLRLYVGVLEALLDEKDARKCNTECYSALLP